MNVVQDLVQDVYAQLGLGAVKKLANGSCIWPQQSRDHGIDR